MIIQEGITTIDLTYQFTNRDFFCSAALLWDDKDVILCDTGLPGQISQIQKEMERIGIPFEKLTKIIVSHQDVDHIGCLRAITDLLPHVQVYATAIEKKYITGEEPFIHPLEFTTKNVKPEAKADFENLNAKVDHIVEPGDTLPFCGGIQLIGTPGHSPGQIALYHIASKTLITNDSLAMMFGEVVIPYNTSDLEAAKASIRKLGEYDFDQILFYHGGLIKDNARQLYNDFVAKM